MKHRKKVLSDKSFAAIWEASSKAKSYRELCSMAFTSKYFNPLYLEKNSGLNLEEVYTVLENIYEAYNMTFAQIMTEAKTTNSKLRDCFCIPEKSIEAWKSGRNKCPDYIRLMLIRYYHLLNLGKYIYTQGYEYYMETIPRVYEVGQGEALQKASLEKKKDNLEKVKSEEDKIRKTVLEKEKFEGDKFEIEDYKEIENTVFSEEETAQSKKEDVDDVEMILKSLSSYRYYEKTNGTEKYAKKRDNKESSSMESSGIEGKNRDKINNKRSQIVDKTDYLDEILKRRKDSI